MAALRGPACAHRDLPVLPEQARHCSKVTLAENTTRIPSATLRRGLVPAVGLVLVMLVIQLLPLGWQNALQYDRPAMAQGEYWRLLTSNFVHLGWSHFALNVAGLALILWIFGADRPAWRWGLGLLLASITTSLGVHLFSPGIFWMVGLSGALHGLFVLGALGWIMAGDRLGWGLLAGVAAKLLFEQTMGEVPFTAAIVGGSVVTDAHLCGAFGGLLAALLELGNWRKRASSL